MHSQSSLLLQEKLLYYASCTKETTENRSEFYSRDACNQTLMTRVGNVLLSMWGLIRSADACNCRRAENCHYWWKLSVLDRALCEPPIRRICNKVFLWARYHLITQDFAFTWKIIYVFPCNEWDEIFYCIFFLDGQIISQRAAIIGKSRMLSHYKKISASLAHNCASCT